jgi:hypothetical protein
VQQQRRQSVRIPYVTEVWLDSSISPARMSDLSTAGAFLDTRATLNPGDQVRLRFELGGALLEVAALVRYAVRNIGMGVSFVDLAPEHLAAIEGLIASHGEPRVP